MLERRGPFDETRYSGQGVNPTMNAAIKAADRDKILEPPDKSLLKIRPMRLERLRVMGGPYTDEDQARLLYDECKSAGQVAELMGRSEYWVRQVCAWDIDQRRQATQSA